MLSQQEQLFLFLMIFFIMFGVGASLIKKDFEEVLLAKKAWLVGMISQFLIMPLLGFIVVSVFHFPDEISIGILIISSSPGGSTSNLFTYFSKGQTALSIVMTCSSTIASFILMPLSLWFYLKHLKHIDVTIPYQNILITLVVILVPVLCGLWIRLKKPRYAYYLEKIAHYSGLVVILVMIFIWIPKLWNGVNPSSLSKYVGIVTLNVGGLLGGYLLSLLLGLSKQATRAVTFETGIQNAPLAFAICLLSFTGQKAILIGEVPLLYGAISVGVGIAVTLNFKLWDKSSK